MWFGTGVPTVHLLRHGVPHEEREREWRP